MKTILGGPADKAGIKFSINPDTIVKVDESDFNKIINNPRITRVPGGNSCRSGFKNKKEVQE